MSPARTADLAALRGNRLLALLDDGTLAALAPEFQHVPLELRATLVGEGKPVRHVWFPLDGVISMLAAVEGAQRKIEVGTIGNEGMCGLTLFLGAPRAPGVCFVQVPGSAWRMQAAAFQRATERHAQLAAVLHRYAYSLLVLVSQGTACNRVHTPLQRCARWLLMTADRVQGPTFHLTQEFLAHMVGERRATVSQVASQLQARRMIAYSRGRITLLDRERLEDAACPCYRVIREGHDSVLGTRGH